MSTVLGAPIERRPLHEELADQLRRLIIEGDLRPGEKISEKLLCDQFAVSRTPLREALKILMTEGLVLLTPNRGASVTELTIDDLEELFPIIGALEALSGELACQSITDEEIELLATCKQKWLNATRGAIYIAISKSMKRFTVSLCVRLEIQRWLR